MLATGAQREPLRPEHRRHRPVAWPRPRQAGARDDAYPCPPRDAAHARTHNGFDNFCLRRGYGIRVGYPSLKLLRSLARSVRNRTRSRIVIALTANRYYALDGVRPGTRARTAVQRLHGQRPAFRVGLNDWYLVPGRAAYGVLKVRAGRVQEVGVVTRSVTRGRAAQRRLFRSMNAV